MYLYTDTYIHTRVHIYIRMSCIYGVALISRIDEIIGLFCKRALSKRRYSAKETYNLIDPTDRSHPICIHIYANCVFIYTQAAVHGSSPAVMLKENIASFIGLFCKRDL